MEVKTAKVRRENKLAIMLSDEMRERLAVVAQGFGMPPSTMASFAVAAWVQQQEQGKAMTRMAIMDVARKAGEKLDAVEAADFAEVAMVVAARKEDAQGLLDLPESWLR